MNDRITTGGCLCGAVRFEAAGEPLWVGHCHCRSCRRGNGAALATFVGFASGGYQYIHGEPKGYHSSPGVTRSFCATCGTPLTFEGERWPGEVHVHISTLDRPEDFEPQGHSFYGERIPWFDTADDLPRHEKSDSGS